MPPPIDDLPDRPRTIWFTGLCASGKTTLGRDLHAVLVRRGVRCAFLDGDELRRGPCADLGYGAADRLENVRRAAAMARRHNDAGTTVICSLIAPLAAHRELAKALIAPHPLVLVYLDTPLAVCEVRDPKGLYAEVRAGRLSHFTGISAPYEPPVDASLVLSTHRDSREVCLAHLLCGLSLELRVEQFSYHDQG